MINPYKNVNWNDVYQIASVSHAHTSMDSYYSEAQQQLFFQRVVNGGVRHFALSNYYPSESRYPLTDYYDNVPADAISCPNAEHHNFASYSALHINGLGSFYESGSVRNYVNEHWVPESPIGVNKASWKAIFPQIFAQLQFSDGGGVTINHPIWSSLTKNTITEMLDFDERVLGIEIFNESCEIQNQTGWALEIWDGILSTGRRCWGFCVPDHTAEQGYNPWLGRNILLVSSDTEHECLKAYREGRFYSKLGTSNLKFSSLNYSDGYISASAENANNISVIIDGQKTTFNDASLTVPIPSHVIYARIEASNDSDQIFSNPIIFRTKNHGKTISSKAMLW